MTCSPNVLVLSSRMDAHADMVVQALEQRDARPIRFDTADFPRNCRLTYRADSGGWHGEIDLGRRRLPLSELHAAWLGRPNEVSADPALEPMAARFAVSESKAAMVGVLHLDDVFWMNHPDRVIAGQRKVVQLQRAAALGFEVPRTLVTNDPAAVREFYEACDGNVIYKPLSRPIVSKFEPTRDGIPDDFQDAHGLIYTNRVTPEDLAAADSVVHAANLFQENVEKAVELRVTCVGHRVFAVEIHSQANEKTRQDWRHYDLDNTPHMPHDLDAEVAQMCVDLTRGYGLVYSAIDLILTPEGRHVFLEINPVGLWQWLEPLTGLGITDAVADLLVAGRVETWRAEVQAA